MFTANRETLAPQWGQQPSRPTSYRPAGQISTIVRVVSEHYGVRIADMIGPRRTADIVVPRQAAFELARDFTGASLPMIGRYFRRDHSTVIHGIGRSKAEGYVPPELRASVEAALAPPAALVFRTHRFDDVVFRSRRARG